MVKKIILTVTALAITVFYFYYNPAIQSFGPPCLIHKTTGLYCWGCGGQRAFHALLHGEFRAAFHNNLLIFFVIPLLAAVLYSELFDDFRLFHYLRRRWVLLLAIGIFILFTIIRNLTGFEFLIPTN